MGCTATNAVNRDRRDRICNRIVSLMSLCLATLINYGAIAYLVATTTTIHDPLSLGMMFFAIMAFWWIISACLSLLSSDKRTLESFEKIRNIVLLGPIYMTIRCLAKLWSGQFMTFD